MITTKLKKISVAIASVTLLSATTIGPAFADDSMNMAMEGNGGTQAAPNTQGQAQWFTDDIQPLNNSGVHGHAQLKLQGNQLTVWMNASGLETNQEHMQHIHGLTDGSNSSCPTTSANVDNDSTISLAEGLPFYGPILQSLTPFQTPGADGSESYQQTFTVNTSDPTMDVLPLVNREIVLHGMTVAANADLSNPNAGYDASLPVACGHIVQVSGNDNDNGNGNTDGQGQSGTNIHVSGNGVGSQNNVNVHDSNTTSVSQTNDTRVINDIRSRVNTGNNDSSFNTGRFGFLNTGRAMSSTSVFNGGSMNMFRY